MKAEGLATAKPEEGQKAEPAKPAASSDVDDTPREVKSEAGKNAWKTVKAERDQLAKERDELRAKLESGGKESQTRISQIEAELNKAKAEFDPVKFKQLSEEREQLWSTVRHLNVQALPEFKKNFTEPLKQLTQGVLASVSEADRPGLDWLLKQPQSAQRDQKLDEIMIGLSPLAASRIGNTVTRIDEIRARMENVLAQEEEVSKQYEAQQAADRERQTAQKKLEREQVLSAVASSIRSQKFPGLTEVDGDDKHNASVNAAFAQAETLTKELLDNPDAERIAKISFLATAYQAAIPSMKRQFEKLQEAEATIAKLTAAQPRTRDTSSSSGKSDLGEEKTPFRKAIGMTA
jgi:hypothetical protein